MVKVSRIEKVNDLFELQPHLRISRDKRKRFQKIRAEISDKYGFICFSSDWQEPIMWGHYADSNKGIALGFEFTSTKYSLESVKYPEEGRRIRLDPDNINPSRYIKALGFTKYHGWSYEKEHRFFVKLDECVLIEDNYFFQFSNHLALRKVIVGPEHRFKNRKTYKTSARYFLQLLKRFDAEVIVSRAEFGKYRIRRCGLWTPRFEVLMRS